MKIINTNTLTSDQRQDIENLIYLCKIQDGTEGIRFLESDMNEYPDFDCFYLLYENAELISFLSVFIPNAKECEIYSYTLPVFRKKGCFSSLLKAALKQLDFYEIHCVYFVCEPESHSGKQALASVHAVPFSSEYILKYNTAKAPQPEYSLKLCYNKKLTHFETLLKNKIIGKCDVDHSDFCSTIYNFEVEACKRGQGYGKETLLLIIEHLLNNDCENIMLHLSNTNKAAYHLYMHNGFIISKQLDYWKLINS
jgi:RimJ/RimL family protein N-acetyltransferase